MASATLLAAVAFLLAAARPLTGGRLVYALDDAYIHLAVARNLATHGVWGVTPHAFTSCTSSILWPLLLAGWDLVRAPAHLGPLALNVLACLAALAVAAALLRDKKAVVAGTGLVALVLVTPLPTLVLGGMEHSLHVFAVLLLALALVRVLEGGTRVAPLAVAAALATAVRYESLFLVAAAVVALAATKRGRAAWAAFLGGVLPPLLYGVVSLAHGWPPLPSSVLLKGAPLALNSLAGWVDLLGGRAARALVEAPHVLVLVAAALALAALRTAAPAADRILAAVFAAAALLHLELAAVGWFYRYEAYLVAFGLVVVVRLAFPLPAREPLAGAALAAAVAVLAVPLGVRAISALRETPRACRNIYEQQYQMGLFLRAGYPGGAVMANDIGAVAFLADVRLLDLYGLATRETARARRQGTLDRAFLERATEEFGPDVIVIYRSWFADALPAGWIEVGTWRVPEKVVVADRTVSFFAPGPEKARRLAAALAAFQPELPASVVARVADAPAGP